MKKISLFICSALILCSCNKKQPQVKAAVIKTTHTPLPLQCSRDQQWISIDHADPTGHAAIKSMRFDAAGHFRMIFSGSPELPAGNTVDINGTAAFYNTAPESGTIILYPHMKDADRALLQPGDTYTWEKISFPHMPAEDFLVLAKNDAGGKTQKSTAVKLRLR